MRPRLILTRGIPAAGKTTWARAWVAEDDGRRTRVNRDDLRLNLFGKPAPLSHEQEQAVTYAQHAAVRRLLAKGRDVVVDDTNLRIQHVKALVKLAYEVGASVEVRDFEIELEDAIARDAAREGVGENVIRKMHQRWRSVRMTPLDLQSPESDYVYEPNPMNMPAWLVDIDGTVAQMNGRSPYDYSCVDTDLPNKTVINVVRMLSHSHRIVFLSGRPETCREATELWLVQNVTYGAFHFALYMRAEGDSRNDAIIKEEIFRAHVAPQYNVRGVLDDRNRVVDMWRRIGLTCLQVAPGDF